MSWSDPCGVCNSHRADCECETFDNVNGKYNPENLSKSISQEEKDKICKRDGHKWSSCITVYCSVCGLSQDY